jgi:2'-5' RNA ligase
VIRRAAFRMSAAVCDTRGMPGAVVSIELLLDEATERAVRAEWQRLAEAGLSSMAAHTASSNRPHLTLLVREMLPDPSFDAILTRPAFAVVLGAPLLFGSGDRRVLARSVIPSQELLDLHARVHALAGAGDDAPHTSVGAWTPHVTLARQMKLTDAATALPLIGGELHARARGLRRWDSARQLVTSLGEFAPAVVET